MKRVAYLIGAWLLPWIGCAGSEFTVLVYNVENLFDLDGVALYSDYEQSPRGDYGAEQLLGKLRSIHRTLSAVNDGAGPEVVMFQEFELDRTPFDRPAAEDFLRVAQGHSVAELLSGATSVGLSVANLPVELLLLKYLEDNGMKGYRIAQPDPYVSESHPAHKNVVFSRFPITHVRQRPVLDARDVLIVELDVHGNTLILLNNHWKSGASSTELEPVRVQNAHVVRAEVEAILGVNPSADIIVAGDLNCYYNHAAVFPELPQTGVNHILRSTGREVEMVGDVPTKDLYNLWFELPMQQRGSEVWMGKWGTLMQMLISQGLYDNKGIRYIDNSFKRLILGDNVDQRWGRPISWTNFGGGSGYSDHLPVYARFETAATSTTKGFENLSDEQIAADRPVVDLRRMDRRAVPSLDQLAGMDDRTLADNLGELFAIKHPLSNVRPARIMLGDRELMIYTPIRAVRDVLDKKNVGDVVESYVELDTYRSVPQVVIADESWFSR